jgi:4-hydroxybenzoate polyprenyltransferase
VAAYPLAKRFTNWPQAVLGLTFNWGALLGWCALMDDLYLPVTLPLYAAGVSWTLFYDTIYAHQDKRDDIKIGVKSTALYLGDKTRPWLRAFASSATFFFILAGYMNGQGVPYYISVAMASAYMLRQAHMVQLDDRSDCFEQFNSSRRVGQLITAGLLCDILI